MEFVIQDTYLPYVGGEFIASGKIVEIQNPYNNKKISTTYLCDPEIMELAIERGKNAEIIMKNLPAFKRYEALLFISEQIIKNLSFFTHLLSMESAKPYKYAKAEVLRAAQTFRIAAEESKRIVGEIIRLDWTPTGENKEGLVKYFPIGLIGGISPYNFPLNLAVHKIAPAIASGNPIILKPSSNTPLSTLALAKIIDQTDLPKGAVSIIPCSRETGNILVTDDRIKLLSFTGSNSVGWQMKEQSKKKKTVLELGGNAGVIITESADISKIIPQCIEGAFAYSGQICIHAQRFFVHEKWMDLFTDMIKEAAEKLVTGDPFNPETDFSCLIDESNAIRIEEWVNEALKQGAKLITGGTRDGAFFEPTILTHTKPFMKVNSEEVFGPVITIEAFQNIEEAIEKINESKFGLQAGVYTNSIHEMNLAFEKIEAGGVIINQSPTLRFDHMPYGGIKDSGIGREGVKYAMEDMMERKILVK